MAIPFAKNFILGTDVTLSSNGEFAKCTLRDGDIPYMAYFFDSQKDKIFKAKPKPGSVLFITGELTLGKERYLVSQERWKQLAPNEENPTKYRMTFLKVISFEYALPKEYYEKEKKKQNQNQQIPVKPITGDALQDFED